jgi:hypothetical protein
LHNLNVFLKQTNHLLRIEKEVLADRVQGLYKAQSYLPLHYHMAHYLEMHRKDLASWEQELKTELKDATEANAEQYLLNDELKYHLAEMLQAKLETNEERDKMLNRTKMKVLVQERNLQQLTEERDKLRKELQQVQKQHDTLNTEYDRLRNKVRHFRQTRSTPQDKVCKNCQKIFNENDNFNWSCTTHSSDFSGELWWCCGRTSKDAVGCQKSKHLCKDEELEEEEESAKLNKGQMAKCSVRISQSCRELGHTHFNCPKDPNPRSVGDVRKEVTRLKGIKRLKKSGSEMVLDKAKSLQQIKIRLGGLHPFSSEHSLRRSNSGILEEDESSFADLQEAKQQCTFDASSVTYKQNLFDTDEFLEIASEKDLRATKRRESRVPSQGLNKSRSLQKKLSRK